MGSPFFVSILVLSIISIFISVFQYRPEFPQIEIEPDNFWKLTDPVKDDETIYPFKIDINENEIQRFKNKINNEEFPAFKNEEFKSYFENLTKVISNFDWKQHQHFMNTFNQYRTEIEGLQIHFLRVSTPLKNKNQKLVPLLIIHGFPGSFWDFFKLIPILTNPSRHGFDFGVKESIQFDVIVPSLPGFLFSEKPEKEEFDAIAITRILSKLMSRLSISKYFLHGCEGFGSDIATLLASIYPENISGLHLSTPFIRPTFSTFTLLKYSWNLLQNHEEINDFTTISDYFGSSKFSYPFTPHIYGISLQNCAIGTILFIENQWKQFSTNDSLINLNQYFTLDEVATEIYLYWLTNSLYSSLIILDRSYNQNILWLNAQVKLPTSISYSKNAPWKCSEDILAHKYFNVTRQFYLPKGGLFHHLQDAQKTAEDIFSFVELQLI